MGGTVTQSRSWPDKRVVNWIDGVPGSAVDLSLHLGTPSQSTTSFRTGRRVPDGAHDDEDLELLSSKTYQDVRKALYSQAKRSRTSAHDTGHPFQTERTWQKYREIDVTADVTGTGGVVYRYAGPIVMRVPGGPVLWGWQPSPAFDAVYYGTKAISDSAPTRRTSSLVTALGELKREGLPGLIGAATLTDKSKLRSLGSEHLNVQFGLKPLARDIALAAYAVSESSRLLTQYARDSGQQVRRRRQFDIPDVISTSTYPGECTTLSNTSAHALWGIIGGGGARYTYGAGQIVEHTVIKRRVWFSGAYTYFAPIGSMGRIASAADKADRLLGLELTPEVLYNLTPWSWLADWQTNLGDVISNVSNFQTDNLVLRYGYLMCETQTHKEYTFYLDSTWARAHASYNIPRVFTQSYTLLRKERVKASPFGFALDPGSYSSRQWAILAALGLTRAPNTLP